MKLFVLVSREQMQQLATAPWGIGESLVQSYLNQHWLQDFELDGMRGSGQRTYLRLHRAA